MTNLSTKNDKRIKNKAWNQQPIADLNHPEGFGVLGEKYFTDLAVHGTSPRTIETKRALLRSFVCWCEPRCLEQPNQVTHAISASYQKHLHHYRKDGDKPLAMATQRLRLTAVKVFYRWLAKQGYLSYSPLEMIELPKRTKQLPKSILSEKEVEQVLNIIDINTITGLRDRAMIETLYSTGIRRLELLSLQLNNLDRSRGWVRVNQGKGHKDRIIPIGDRALQWIEKYLNESRLELLSHRNANKNETTLFISHFGKPLSSSTITSRFRDYLDAAGIDKPGSVHIFRHTSATLMLENGADIRHIQAMLGHEDLSTTQIYTQVAITHLKDVHTRTHPAKLTVNREKS